MKRKHKRYSKPRRSFDKQRIEKEAKIIEEFGLKNKREIWKAEAKIKAIREKAKKLIPKKEEEKEALFTGLKKLGFKVDSIGDVLSLTTRDYLNRRLQTILVKKRIAKTPRAARQLIVHKKVIVGDNVVNSPSYIVPIDLEEKITLRKKLKIDKAVEIKEENKNESSEVITNEI